MNRKRATLTLLLLLAMASAAQAALEFRWIAGTPRGILDEVSYGSGLLFRLHAARVPDPHEAWILSDHSRPPRSAAFIRDPQVVSALSKTLFPQLAAPPDWIVFLAGDSVGSTVIDPRSPLESFWDQGREENPTPESTNWSRIKSLY